MGTGEVNRPGASGENPVQGQQEANTLPRRVDQLGRARLQAPARTVAVLSLSGRISLTFRRFFGLSTPFDWFVEQGFVARIEELPQKILSRHGDNRLFLVDLCRRVQAQKHYTSIDSLLSDVKIMSYFYCPDFIRSRDRYEQLLTLKPLYAELNQALRDDTYEDFTQSIEQVTKTLEREGTASWFDLIQAHLMAKQIGSQFYDVCYESIQLIGYGYPYARSSEFRDLFREHSIGWSVKERICFALLYHTHPQITIDSELENAVRNHPNHDKIVVMQLTAALASMVGAAEFANMVGAGGLLDRLLELPNCNEVARLLPRCLDPVEAANNILANPQRRDLFSLLFEIEGITVTPGMSLNEALRQSLSSETALENCPPHLKEEFRELLPTMRYGASVLERIKNHASSLSDDDRGRHPFEHLYSDNNHEHADLRAMVFWGRAAFASRRANAPVARVVDPSLSAEEQLNQLNQFYHDHRSTRPKEVIILGPNLPTLPQMQSFLAQPATPLEIRYRNSPGMDAGGLTRQALQACSDELLSYFADTLKRSDYDNELHLNQAAKLGKTFQLGHLCYLFVKNDIPLPTEQVLSRSIFQQGSRFTASQLGQELWSHIVNKSPNLETLYRTLHPTSEGIKLEDIGIENKQQLKEELLAEAANFQFARGFSAGGQLPITAKSSDIFVANADLRATILASLRFGARVDPTSIEFLTKWIQEAPLPNLTKFMRIISGANALPRGKTILIIHSDTVNYYAHSCARQLDLGRGITDFEMWKMGFENMLDDPSYSDR